MSDLWISMLPALYTVYLAPLALITVGFLTEHKFVSRPAIFANAIALNLHMLAVQNPSTLLVWYANIGLLMAGIAVLAYKTHTRLSKFFYIVGWLYCSILVGIVVLFF